MSKTRKKIRHLSSDVKAQAIRAYQSGESAATIAKSIGVDRTTFHRWTREIKTKGLQRKRSPGSGRPSKIDVRARKKIISILKRPATEFGFETDLWNTSRMSIVCKKHLNLVVSKMALWRALMIERQSYKKVQKKYKEVDEKAQENWKLTVLPKIMEIVKKHRAILYFEDECNIQLSPVMGKSWGPVGEKITHKVTGNRGSVAAMSAISRDGRLVFSLFSGGKRFNAEDIIHFLSSMIQHHRNRHLVVIMDRATCHVAKKVQKFVIAQTRLHVFYLPSRSPEFNPDEQVWSHLKNHDLKSHLQTNVDGLHELTAKKLEALSKDPKKLRGIFKRCENYLFYM